MCCGFIDRVLIKRFRYGEGEARLQTEAFKDSLTRVGGCWGFFGDGGRRIGKRAGNRHSAPGFWKRILLAEEEVFDVSLATFYVFDKEFDKEREFSPGVRLAGGRCGGCGGCGGRGGGCGCARGCRGCGGCGCGVGVGLLLGGLIGGCGGCGGGYGTCWVWSPAYGRWINDCY